MANAIDTTAYIIGAADVYYRAVGVLTPWSNVGKTLDDAVLRVMTEWFRPDNISGVTGPIMGLDILSKVWAEIEFTMPEVAGSKFSLAIPGSRVTAATGGAAGGSPLSTTTTAAVLAGVTTIPLTAVTNGAVGDVIKIDTTTLAEFRTITAISSLNVSFRDPLLFDHASGVAVVESVDDNRTLIEAPILRRQPAGAYLEWALVASSSKGYTELRLPQAISQTTSAEITFGDKILSGIRVKLESRLDPADLNKSPFKLYAPA